MDVSKYNELISIASIGSSFEDLKRPCQVYGIGPHSIAFYDEAVVRSKEILEEIYLKNKEISTYSSYNSYVEYVLPIISSKKEANLKFDDDDEKKIIKYFKSKPIEDITVWREITGIELKKESKIQLGEFTIINWKIEKASIEKDLKYNPEVIWMKQVYDYLIGVKVKARDFRKAQEISDLHFRAFENIIHIIIGYPDKNNFVSILDYDNGLIGRSLLYSDELGLSSQLPGWKRVITPLEIDNDYFKEKYFIKLYELITKNNKNEMQKRLLLAANWLGQAIKYNEIVDGYLKSVIALEILFSVNINGLISPSITYQISESIALILGESVENKIEIEKEIKDLYSKRSSIVHSGNASINRIDYLKACKYSRAIIMILINDEKYSVNKIEEVLELLKRQKYS